MTENPDVAAKYLGEALAPAFLRSVWISPFKRGFDLVAVTALGVLLLPTLVFISFLIKASSRGPILYRRIRLGKGGCTFGLLKFRTMFADADERLEALLNSDAGLRQEYEVFHKLHDDPRRTTVGKVLRRLSLDELPQLWNILKGDMSLVGPRPYDAGELPDMRGCDRTILRIRPGLTGLWQVSGRSRLSFDERVEIEVRYVRNLSLWQDVKILFRTLPAVISGEGT